jgi:hypothetical protein
MRQRIWSSSTNITLLPKGENPKHCSMNSMQSTRSSQRKKPHERIWGITISNTLLLLLLLLLLLPVHKNKTKEEKRKPSSTEIESRRQTETFSLCPILRRHFYGANKERRQEKWLFLCSKSVFLWPKKYASTGTVSLSSEKSHICGGDIAMRTGSDCGGRTREMEVFACPLPYL